MHFILFSLTSCAFRYPTILYDSCVLLTLLQVVLGLNTDVKKVPSGVICVNSNLMWYNRVTLLGDYMLNCSAGLSARLNNYLLTVGWEREFKKVKVQEMVGRDMDSLIRERNNDNKRSYAQCSCSPPASQCLARPRAELLNKKKKKLNLSLFCSFLCLLP